MGVFDLVRAPDSGSAVATTCGLTFKTTSLKIKVFLRAASSTLISSVLSFSIFLSQHKGYTVILLPSLLLIKKNNGRWAVAQRPGFILWPNVLTEAHVLPPFGTVKGQTIETKATPAHLYP